MAYLDGKLYIASLGPRRRRGRCSPGAGGLGAFDPATGSYTPVLPIGARGLLTYTFPGDVKVGADGLLYLLNNGPGDQAVYALKPDRPGGTPVGAGRQGRLRPGPGPGAGRQNLRDRYGPNLPVRPGRRPGPGRVGRAAGGFNNIAGVIVDPDNRIYGAETSEQRVHIFDSAGHLLNTVDLRCQPWQMVVAGDWLDVSCQNGLRSLNRKTGEVQVARAGVESVFGAITGLAYGPNNTLYIYDNNTSTIIAYTVQH